jgi:hypothetical protein
MEKLFMLDQIGKPDLDQLASYDLGFLKERFTDAHPCSDSDFAKTVEEFKRFMTLVAKQDAPLAVMSKSVDELWHTFIIHSPQYHEFCEKIFGEYIHHQPHGPQTPVPEEALTNFFDAYRAEFGTVSAEWTDGYDPVTIAHLMTGKIPDNFQYKWSGWTGRNN